MGGAKFHLKIPACFGWEVFFRNPHRERPEKIACFVGRRRSFRFVFGGKFRWFFLFSGKYSLAAGFFRKGQGDQLFRSISRWQRTGMGNPCDRSGSSFWTSHELVSRLDLFGYKLQLVCEMRHGNIQQSPTEGLCMCYLHLLILKVLT